MRCDLPRFLQVTPVLLLAFAPGFGQTTGRGQPTTHRTSIVMLGTAVTLAGTLGCAVAVGFGAAPASYGSSVPFGAGLAPALALWLPSTMNR